jgi:hypothetical protein
MIQRTLQRLAAMQPEELRFRTLGELRKLRGRVTTTLSRPAWQRSALESILEGRTDLPWSAALHGALKRNDYREAHAALAGHFATRRSAFPLNSRDVPAVVAAIHLAFPSAREVAAARADSVIHGRYDLLGYGGLDLGPSPDWHADVVHRRHSPVTYWGSVPYLDPATGDHKIIWELNRHQHWLLFGRAHALSGEARFYDAFQRQLTDWLAANPPLLGTNWASMLELAFRCLAWIWSLELFAGSASQTDREPWMVDLVVALDRQLTHIEHNLSHYFSPNTHLSGEALALYVAGCALPELKASSHRAAIGRSILMQEATRQIRADGGHAELSAHYHRYSTDFYLLAARVAQRANDSAASIFAEAARHQARYLRTICDETGQRPQLGDDDGGQAFPICGRPAEDCRDTLANAAIVLDEPALAIGPAPEESYWMCGAGAAEMAVESTHWPSAALTASGYYVSRTTRGDHLVFDAGPHGFLNGGHAHADALSCTLTVAGRPVLIDPGTATYTMDRELRDRFRSSMMHNTVVVGGRSQAEPVGAFQWRGTTTAEAPIWRSSTGCDYMEGTHAAYAPVRHTRAILAVHDVGWWILDHVLGAEAVATENFWHIHPAWIVSRESAHVCRLGSDEGALALASTAPLTVLAPGMDPLAVRSPAYGTLEHAPVIKSLTMASRETTVATFVPATAELARQLEIATVPVAIEPGPGWHGSGFRVRWEHGAMVLLAAIEAGGVAVQDTSAPPRRWGTAELQTDARVAAVIDRADGRSEAILVNGALIDSSPGHPLVSLSRHVPLLRLTASAMAPTVHEVAGTTAERLQSSSF